MTLKSPNLRQSNRCALRISNKDAFTKTTSTARESRAKTAMESFEWMNGFRIHAEYKQLLVQVSRSRSK